MYKDFFLNVSRIELLDYVVTSKQNECDFLKIHGIYCSHDGNFWASTQYNRQL